MTRRMGLVAVSALATSALGLSQTPTAPDPTTRPVWRTAQATVGTPVVHGDELFALTADHQLIKLSAADGGERWRVGTGEWGATHGHALTLTPDLVLVGEFDIAAFDRVTGRSRWVFTPSEGHAPGPYLGDVVDGRAFTGSASGHLHALDVDSGRPAWSALVVPGGLATVYKPRIDGDMVVAGFTVHTAPARGGVVAVGSADGVVIWQFDFPSAAVSTHMTGGPVVAGDVVLAASGDGRIWALDRHTGAPRFHLPPLGGALDSIVPPGDQDYRALAVVGNVLVAGSTTGYVVGYRLDNRHEAWRFAGGRLGSTAFTFGTHDDEVIVPYVSGFLVALDGTTGRLRWRTNDWQQGFIWPPARSGNVLIAGSRGGLWAFRPSGGLE